MRKTLNRLIQSKAPAATILIRILVGAVFLSEGIQKYIDPAGVGEGRFAKIGFSHPEFTAHFAGAFEIACGTLLILGLLTRLATIPLLIVIGAAIYTTKLPILENRGFWPMAHEARTDFAMLLGLVFLLIVGAGSLSFDKGISSSK
ncbi:MAG: DoxX family protein [Fimbriimonadales bacterium]